MENSKDLILLFKIPMDMRKDFFEIYRHIRHAPSRRFASPGTGPSSLESSSARRLPDGGTVRRWHCQTVALSARHKVPDNLNRDRYENCYEL